MSIETQAVIIVEKPQTLEISKAESIQNSFAAKIKEKDNLTQVYNEIISQEITPELCSRAREARLQLVKVRTGTANIHKAEKEFYLVAGKFVDAIKNKITVSVEQMEENLEKIEKHFEILEAQRLESIKKIRVEILAELDQQPFPNIELMDDETFNTLVTGIETKIANEKEADRLEGIRVENERLENERKDELRKVRFAELGKLQSFVPDFLNLDLRELSDDAYNAILQRAQKEKVKDDAAKEVERQKTELVKSRTLEVSKLLDYFGDISNIGDLKELDYQKRLKTAQDAKAKVDKENEIKENRKSELLKYMSYSDLSKLDLSISEKEYKVLLDKSVKAYNEFKDQEAENKRLAKLAKDQEANNQAEKIEAEKLAKGPIKDQMTAWVESMTIKGIGCDKMNDEQLKLANEIMAKFSSFKVWAKTEISKL